MEAGLAEKLRLRIEAENLSTRAFAIKYELSLDNLYKWLKGTMPSNPNDFKKLERIIDDLENIEINPSKGSDKEVILLGNHRGNERMTSKEVVDSFQGWSGLPMYNEPISASFVETYRDTQVHKPQYYLYDPRFRDCNFGAIITGDSMHSEIRHGDFVACKEITDPRFIVFGEIYYVVANNGLETCKYVARMPKKGAEQNKYGRYSENDYDDDMVLLVPYNKAVDPSPLHKDLILRIYKVRGIVRGY